MTTIGQAPLPWRDVKLNKDPEALPEGAEDAEDGDRFLVAVPLVDGRVDYAVVTLQCDEHFMRLEVEGEIWGWGWADVSHYIALKGMGPK